jgi:uncharacterized membrane protein
MNTDLIRLAICIPCRDMMHSACSYSLYNLAKILTDLGIEHKLFLSPGTLIANQRHELVLSAKEWQATHVLFVDSDIVFSPNHVIDLLEFNEDIVGAAYSKRVEPIVPTAWTKIDDWNSYIKVEEQTESHITVEAMALGFCLIKTPVFDRLELPWFQLGFHNNQYTGEDIEFFRKCNLAGIPIWLDIQTTCKLSHLGTKEFKVVDDIEIDLAT